jgi:hypothetical protein
MRRHKNLAYLGFIHEWVLVSVLKNNFTTSHTCAKSSVNIRNINTEVKLKLLTNNKQLEVLNCKETAVFCRLSDQQAG